MAAWPPALGDVFAGRFELRAQLVEFGVGRCYCAWDRDVDETVALVVLRDDDAASGAVEELREAVRLARRVTHRNVARTYDMAEHGGHYYVSLEYIDGLRLDEWSAGQPSLSAILELVAQLAEGLAAAHVARVVHCNLSPFNVMVEPSGRATIGNFGLARFEAAQTLVQITNRTDGLLRSAIYLAPEQVEGQVPTSAADVYALGLLIYEVLTGAPRFAGEQAVAVANARLTDDLRDLIDPEARDERIPPALAELVALCLAREPEARPSAASVAATARALLQQLRATGETDGQATGRGARHDSLAVLPFRYRGPRDSEYLAEVLLEELVDLLSQTRGLHVLATGTTAGLTGSGDRDPRRLGEALGVDVIVDGTILLAGARLRISARLIEVADGFQLWHERFEGGVADVFELQDRLAKRITEALRVELDIIAHRGEVDAAAVESYLRARQAHLRWRTHGPDGAVAHYKAALARAPSFEPALAHLAMATLLAWFQPREEDGIDWAEEAEEAVDQALARAPSLPETRLAAANLAIQRGQYRECMIHVNEALRIAPTFALAHEFLGRMLFEVGELAQARHHIELAIELDPALSYCYAELARERVYAGDLEGFEHYALHLRARVEHHRPSTAMLHMRVGAWTGNEALIREGLGYLPEDAPRFHSLRRFGELLLAPDDVETIELEHLRRMAGASSPRLQTLFEQLATEEAMVHGDHERALAHLRGACERVLVDIEWLERCPVLAPLRSRPEFAAVRTTVRARCMQIRGLVATERR